MYMNDKILFAAGGVIGGLILGLIFAGTTFSGFRNGGIGMMGSNQNTGGIRTMGNISGRAAFSKASVAIAIAPS